MFAALLHGCALAKLLPGCQPVVVVMTVAFLLAGILMAFFPARLLPLELVVTLLAWGAMRAIAVVSAAVKRRIPAKTSARS